jgi:glyoxylase-like metal-dependent hydrolase (beta-lactamase superfamily II)
MLRSLAEKVLPLDDRIVVLPGHGPQTSVGRERATNPFLAELGPQSAARSAAQSAAQPGPTRGL